MSLVVCILALEQKQITKKKLCGFVLSHAPFKKVFSKKEEMSFIEEYRKFCIQIIFMSR